MTAALRVAKLVSVGLAVPDLGVAQDFYVDTWGLQLMDSGPTEHYLRANDGSHHALSIHTGERALSNVAFAVRDRRDLDAAVSGAVDAGGAVVREPGPAREPGHDFSAAIADPDGNVVELQYGLEKVAQPHAGGVVTPRKLGHVVLNTPQVPAMERFYGALGFQVSDRTIRGMSFLRCNTDHHSLALATSHRTGLQHAAFEVDGIDDVMVALGELTRGGVPCMWGPGRHGPGRNIFTYYKDPAGHIIEYYTDMEQVEEPDDLVPLEERYWGPEHKGDQWGLAGPPPARFKE